MSNFWSGIGLPWGLTIPSVIEPKDDYDVVRSSILWIILTSYGERVMQPELGSDLPKQIFEPNDLTTTNKVKRSVQDAINRWDDRVIFVDFVVKPVGNELKCTVSYKLNVDKKHDAIQILEFNLTRDMVVNSN